MYLFLLLTLFSCSLLSTHLLCGLPKFDSNTGNILLLPVYHKIGPSSKIWITSRSIVPRYGLIYSFNISLNTFGFTSILIVQKYIRIFPLLQTTPDVAHFIVAFWRKTLREATLRVTKSFTSKANSNRFHWLRVETTKLVKEIHPPLWSTQGKEDLVSSSEV